MNEKISAVMVGLVLVLFSMIAGGVVYLVVRDYINRSIHRKD